MFLSDSFHENVEKLNGIFEGCADIKQLDVELKYMNNSKGRIYFVEEAVSDITLRKVLWGLTDVEEVEDIDEMVKGVMSGNAILIIDGRTKALKIRGTGYPGMGVSEAKDEQVIRGSSEGFSDSYKTNQVLVRKRIRCADLKIEEISAGVRTDTGIALLYMDGIVRKDILESVKERINSFKIDGFMDSGVIEQLTSNNEWTPFPQYKTTERPDRAAQFLLNGHVVVLVDNSPIALVLPVNIGSFMKTADDYYGRWGIVTFERILRYIAVFFAVSLPALYISVVNFHPEILPNNLVLVFIKARQDIPYPVFIEVILMEISFELIREAGIRIPGAMGNAIGIVGGLIVGSAAVEASLASPIIVIIVALTALCSFTIPNNEFSSAFRLIKYFLILLSAVYGIYGYIIGIICIMLHLSGLKSYGFPYLGPVAAAELNGRADEKDFILRAPYQFLTRRPIFSVWSNRRKLSMDSGVDGNGTGTNRFGSDSDNNSDNINGTGSREETDNVSMRTGSSAGGNRPDRKINKKSKGRG